MSIDILPDWWHATHFSLYHSRSNVMTFITEAPLTAIEDQLELLARQLKEPIQFAQFSIATKAHIDVIFRQLHQYGNMGIPFITSQ
ncbi:hypothetical protein [Acetobacterium wieringae]|uniref:hypothetical protein n=1 Tax=Acetobacterium wieringae TaxID=52694 RepID=UPI003157F997